MATTELPMELLSVESLRSSLTKQQSKLVTQDTVNLINRIDNEYGFDGNFKTEILSYTNVLQTGRYKINDYVKAVHYCGYIIGGMGKQEAYEKVFPELHAKRVADGNSASGMSASSSAYFRNQLVQKVLAQATVPVHIFHGHHKHAMIEKLAKLATESDNERIQMESADRLLNHLGGPEEVKVELDIGSRTESAVQTLEQTMAMMIKSQREAMANGASVKDIAHQKLEHEDIMDGELTDD